MMEATRSRAKSTDTKDFFGGSCPEFCYFPDGEFHRTSLANTLYAVDGKEPKKVMLSFQSISLQSIRQVDPWLRKRFGLLMLVKLDFPRANGVKKWTFKRDHDVFLLRLSGTDWDGDSIEHFVVVDISTRRVHDQADIFLLKLLKGVLHACIGYRASLTGLGEIYEFTKLPAMKAKRHLPKSTEKKRELLRKG